MAKKIAGAAHRPDRRRTLRGVPLRAAGGDGRQLPGAAPPDVRRIGPAKPRRRKGPTTDGSLGLHKDAIRRIALEKLEVVYRDWNFKEPPFADFATEAGERREDARAFLIALVAGLLGGLSDAIEQNNKAIAAALARRAPGRTRRNA